MTLSAQISAQISAVETSALSVGSAKADMNLGALLSLVNGTGNGKADLCFVSKRQLAASASENLDLAGVLTDVFGSIITAAKVKAILIVADAGNTGDLVVGNGTTPFLGPLGGTTPTIAVRPAGVVLFADPNGGWTVVAGTGDLLKVTNGAAAVANYQISIIAASA